MRCSSTSSLWVSGGSLGTWSYASITPTLCGKIRRLQHLVTPNLWITRLRPEPTDVP